jgi:glycine cleavage system aminomethyltransferase T/glycine/D-amino acid oxidase-like deaminating enzyme
MASPRVVIIGAGIVGAGLADELTERGWTNVTVLEQGRLWAAGGSSSHAPGLIFQTNGSKALTEYARYTVEKLAGLTVNGQWCFRQVGGLEVASTPERLEDLKRKVGLATSWGIEGRLLDPDETKAMWPLLDRDRVLGSYHVPTDGFTKAVRATEAQGRRAIERGARFADEQTVTGIRTDDGRVRAVITDRDEFPADIVVSCAGIWGPRIGAMVGMRTPLQPLAHQYTRTTPVPALAEIAASDDLEAVRPILRHQDRDLYFREHGDRLGIGAYGHRPMPVDPATLLPPREAAVMPSVLEFTPADFEESWGWARDLVPALRDEGVRIESGINGVFSFTPDTFPLMGESSDVAGFWVAEAVWVTHSAGVARAMAEWLVDGAPRTDVHESDVNRFDPHQLGPAHIRDRGIQNYNEIYDILHPLQPMEAPRPLRVSPFHQRQEALGAVFLEAGGWERPHWYEANRPLVERYADRIPERQGWAARYWSPIAGAEALATRDGVAMYDMTSLKRIVVSGPGACAFLERMTTNRIDRPVGTVVYTLMLQEDGGIRSDLTIARVSQDTFQIGANGNLDLDWLRRQIPADGSVRVVDTTAGTCCIGLWGPRARDVVEGLTDDDLSNEAFRYFQARDTYLGQVPVRMLRLSYVGELGWEIYTSADMGLKLWDTLWEAASRHGVVAGGRSGFTSLRLEKGYRSWGTDMTTEHDPFEAGLGFAVRMDKGEFLGRPALERRADAPPARRLACLTFDRTEDLVLGKEPIRVGGETAGYVTSAAFGYTIGRSIAYGWLPAEAAVSGTRVEVDWFGERLPATVTEDPLFDPGMTRLRS